MSQQHPFGYWLKRSRKALDLTQAGLANQVGCSSETIRKIEAEERRPSAQIVERLAEIFNIPESEQKVFLRFARGDWRPFPLIESENAPWRASPSAARSRLPSRLTALIGREQAMAQVHQYLASESTRLVTLTGPPGIGKTSLSQQVAEDLMGNFSDGVFFVALAPLNDPNLVVSTIEQTLRFEERGQSSAMDLLKEGIADKKLLLVLDNFEHLLDAAPIVPELLRACPNLKILVTSREALRVPGEWIYSVPPLHVPEISPSSSLDLKKALKYSAVDLFVERARAVHSDFKLNPENANAIAAICARLDGLPLAIELIAARVRLISPQELLSRMDARFTLYADGMRAIASRQKTLHNAIAWSYDLLTPEEQKLFAHLGVFAGGFTLEAAAQVTGNPDILTAITALLDKSLVQRVDNEHGASRFAMLFTIREFALDRLNEMNKLTELRDQHLKYFLNLAEQADQEIHGPHQIEWLDRLEIEHDNYRAALDWCITNGNIESALYLIGSFSGLGRFWSVRSYYSEARNWFDKVRASPDVTLYPIAYATALNGMSFIASLQSDFVNDRAMAEESQRICESLGTDGELGLAGALLAMGLAVAWGDGDIARAEAYYERAAVIYKACGTQWEYAFALLRLGITACRRTDYEKSRLFFEDSLGIFRELDDAFGLARVYGEIGYLFFSQGDYAQARRMDEQALYYDKKLHFQQGVCGSLISLAVHCRFEGDYDQAEGLLEEASGICREFNLLDDISPFYSGCVKLHGRDFAKARVHFIEHLKINQKHNRHVNFGESLIGLGSVAAGFRQFARSARLVGAGQAVHDSTSYTMPAGDLLEIGPLLQITREQLGEERFEALTAEGRALTMEQAIAYALEDKK